jgi:hypothetical protein
MRIAIVICLVSAGCFDWESLSPEAACSRPVGAPDIAADHVIHLLPAGAAVMDSSTCSESFWSSAPEIRLERVNPTNNTLSCRIMWEPARTAGAQDVVHGCCVATDTDLQATYDSTTRDQDVYNDDSFEYYLTLHPNTRDDTTTKVSINIQASIWDVDFPDGDFDNLSTSYDAGVIARTNTDGQTINDVATLDTGYTIKWRANVGFRVPAPHVAGCGFMMSDNDNGVRMLWNAYGTGRNDINDETKWGRCLFSCTPPPGQ